MNLRPRRNQGLGLIALILFIAAILIIGGILCVALAKIARKCLPPPDNGGTNHMTVFIDYTNVENFSESAPIIVPDLRFPELAKPEGQTPENPFGNGWLEIERTTNFVNWETILVITNPGVSFKLEDDTNPPPDRAFYRGKFVYP